MIEHVLDWDLGQVDHNGVYPVAQDSLAALAHAAVQAGGVLAHIDLTGCAGKAELLARIGEALEFPDGMGRNWDALADCLGDLSWLPGSGYTLLFAGGNDLYQANEDAFATLVDILNGIAAVWQQQQVPFQAFIALPAHSQAATDPATGSTDAET
jgi:RNAse (barnase) inhibitor barstar